MKAVILLLAFWLIKVQAKCPLSCNCTETTVSCFNRKLEDIPDLSTLETPPKVLDFSGNHLYFVSEENFDFPQCDEVIEIYLNRTELTDMGQGTFDNLENLQTLHLGDNLLSNSGVPSSIIENLDNMMMLDLSKNQLDGPMPIIKSESLKVLGLVGSKISSIPNNALDFLPNLNVLLLDQNNLKDLSFEPFKKCKNEFTVKLTYNPWICTCENLEAFYELANHKFIDPADLYQCTSLDDDTIANIFKQDFTEKCPGLKVSSTQPPFVKDEPYGDEYEDNNVRILNQTGQNDYMNDDDSEKNIEDIEPKVSKNCWQVLVNDDGLFKAVALTTLIGYVGGFLSGILLCRLLYILKYRRLEQTSDSQVELLKT